MALPIGNNFSAILTNNEMKAVIGASLATGALITLMHECFKKITNNAPETEKKTEMSTRKIVTNTLNFLASTAIKIFSLAALAFAALYIAASAEKKSIILFDKKIIEQDYTYAQWLVKKITEKSTDNSSSIVKEANHHLSQIKETAHLYDAFNSKPFFHAFDNLLDKIEDLATFLNIIK